VRLNDGTVIPSHLGVVTTRPRPSGIAGDFSVKVGEVVEVIYRDDDRSVSKRFTEYSVQVQHRAPSGVGLVATYGHCFVASLFGSTSDYLKYTLRARSNDAPVDDAGLGDGAKVFLLCVNGEVNNAFIFAAALGPGSDPDPLSDDGHHLTAGFNGATFGVDQDGAITLGFAGATKADGSPAEGVDEAAGGSLLALKSDGDVELSHGDQAFQVLHADKKVRVAGTGGVDVDAGSSDATISAGSVKVGSANASEALMLGTTQRSAEAALDQALSSALSSASAAAAAAAGQATAIAAAIAATATAHLAPISGPIVGSVPLSTAGVAASAMAGSLGALASALADMGTALAAYEAQGSTFLSTRHVTE
jgi:hypothetical protein